MGSYAAPLAEIGGTALMFVPGGQVAGLALMAGGAGLGAIQQASAQRAAGESQQQESDYEATLLRQKSMEDNAAAQRKAEAIGQNTDLSISRARAVGAAGGGGSDPTVLNLIGQLAGAGKYKQDAAIYEGKVEGQNDTTSADLKQWEGGQAKAAGNTAATGTLIKGASSLFSRYGQGGFSGGGGPTITGNSDVNDGFFSDMLPE